MAHHITSPLGWSLLHRWSCNKRSCWGCCPQPWGWRAIPPWGGWKKWVLGKINTAVTHSGSRAVPNMAKQGFLFWKGAIWVQKQRWGRPLRMGSKKPCQLRKFSHFHASTSKSTRFELRQQCISKSKYHFLHYVEEFRPSILSFQLENIKHFLHVQSNVC